MNLDEFVENEDNFLLSKKVNLGLDLQGGSYLLLEVDSQPVVKQKLQNKLISLRKELKDKNIKYKELKLANELGREVGKILKERSKGSYKK